jgi:hypothetical protein
VAPDLAGLPITTSGVGPLMVAMIAPAANPGAAMIECDPDDRVGEVTETEGDPGRWIQSGYSSDTTYVGEPATPFHVDATDTGVHRIDVMGTSPHTVEGIRIRIGSTLAELRAAHPDLQGPSAGPVSQVWWVQDAAGSIAFETQGDMDGMRPPGTEDGVIPIRVLAPGVSPDFVAANNGNVAGACF